MKTSSAKQQGFVLLITLVVISIVLAIGLTLLSVTTKQLSLSNLARESEIALHAATTGIECMQYHRLQPATRVTLLTGDPTAPLLSCAGDAPADSSTAHNDSISTNGFLYNYRYEHNVDGDKCVETSLYMIDLSSETSDVNAIVNEGLDTITCEGGSVCTTIFSRGFNRSCSNKAGLFTVQRELTIEF